MIEDQPAPVVTDRTAAWDIVIEYMVKHHGDNAYSRPSPDPSLWDIVIADMSERHRVGVERYGTPLTAHNGRDHLIDAYQEALDMAVYLAAWLDEKEMRPDSIPRQSSLGKDWWAVLCIQQTFHEHIRTVVRLRAFIEERSKSL